VLKIPIGLHEGVVGRAVESSVLHLAHALLRVLDTPVLSMGSLPYCILTSEMKKKGVTLPEPKTMVNTDGKLLIFAVDEASFLFMDSTKPKRPITDRFKAFRRALKIIPQKNFPVVALLLDTNSKVGKFAPVQALDSSARASLRGERLVHHFYFFPSDVAIG
jgi:hypothetical protein